MRLTGRFELLHLPLSSACRLVRILRSVVESLVLAMLNAGHDLPLCRAIARKLVGDHDTGRPHLPLQQFAQQPLGRLLVASALDQDVEHDTGLVDGSPKPMLYPGILSTTSSRCHLSPTRGRRRRIWLANGWPNLRAHCRTVSWLTMMPRAASNSSTMRSPSGKRKYSHTA